MSNKIGVIIEAPRGSGDQLVFRWLISQFCPDMVVEFIGNRNKKELVADCIPQTKVLIENDLCDKVLIIYDLMPRWLESKPLNPQEEILAQMCKENLPIEKIEFICIHQMLETWLIADENAVPNYKVKKHKLKDKQVVFNGGKGQINNPKPKKLIEDYLSEYNPATTALGIIQEANLEKVSRRSESFKDFQAFIKENC